MLDNALQHCWKLVVEKLYRILPCLDGCMHFAEGGKMFINVIQAIIAVEHSVRRLVQQDAVDGIRRLPDVWRWVLHVGRDYF